MSAGKKKRSQSTAGEPLKAETVLQALVLADSFNQRFPPISLELPRCLFPVANVPVIEYTLEFLAMAGVGEIFVFCCAHAEMIQEYLSESKWKNSRTPLVKTIVALDCYSVGDALRTVESKGVIHGDFVLVNGDVVSNATLQAALSEHRKRREEDKQAIMTMVLKKAAPSHRSRSLDDDLLLTVGDNGQLLHYENSVDTNHVDLDLELFAERSRVRLFYDLMDCHIDICAPEVLFLFQDNFDYQDLREDFVRGVLSDDILGNKIFTSIISSDYAAEVKDRRTYDTVSKDVIQRWAFPMVPDTNICGTTTYSCSRNRVYKEADVSLARSSVIDDDSVIGAKTTVGAGTRIAASVVGRGCEIGRNVTIKGAYIWDGVTVEDGVTIEGSMVCTGARIREGASLESGVIISCNVVVGKDAALPADSIFTACSQDLINQHMEDDGFDDDEGNDGVGPAIVDPVLGEDGVGRRWTVAGNKRNNFGATLELDDDYDDDSEFDSEEEEEEGAFQFVREVRDTIMQGVATNESDDDLVLELTSLKLSSNKSFAEVARGIVWATLDQTNPDTTEKRALVGEVFRLVKKNKTLLEKFMISEDEQLEVLDALRDYALDKSNTARFLPVYQFVLKIFYDLEILGEEIILSWADDELEDEDADQACIKQAEEFLTWLREAEEEDDDDDED